MKLIFSTYKCAEASFTLPRSTLHINTYTWNLSKEKGNSNNSERDDLVKYASPS